MNYTTSLSGLICPPKSSKFLEFAHWRFPSLILPASCIIPISIFCPAPSLWAITTLELPKDVSPAFSAGNPLHPTQCRAEASLLMPPKVMTRHANPMELCPTSIALSLELCLKGTLPFHSTDHASYLSHLWALTAQLCGAGTSQGTCMVSLKTCLLPSVSTQPTADGLSSTTPLSTF